MTVFGWSGWAALGSLITALAAIGALVFTSQSLRATQKQIEISEQGQLTERFGKAVEQLGSEKLELRLGRIYALERLARDSARDHPTVMQVLAAFVRSHTPGTACSSKPEMPTVPTVDVQAALTVIGRDAVHAELKDRLDLRKTCLVHGNLTDANLARAYLTDAILTRADLTRVYLTGAYLSDADLDLDRADLSDANLTGANLTGAHLSGADLSGADLSGADFTDVDLIGVTGLRAPPSVRSTSGPAR